MLILVFILVCLNFFADAVNAHKLRSIRISLLNLRRSELYAKRRSALIPAIVVENIRTTYDAEGTIRLLGSVNMNLEELLMLVQRVHDSQGLR